MISCAVAARNECGAMPMRPPGRACGGAGRPFQDASVEVESAHEAPLSGRRSRAPEAAMGVEDRQQRQPDPGLGGRGGDPHSEFGRVIVGAPVGLVMQVVELGHRSEAAFQHFDEGQGRDGLHVLGREPSREAIHLLAPGPEMIVAPAPALGQPGKAALEGVAMKVGHARQRDPAALLGARPLGGPDTRPDLDDESALEFDQHIVAPSFGCQGSVEKQLVHGRSPGRHRTCIGPGWPVRATIAGAGVSDKSRIDRVWRHARIATLDPGRPGLGLIEDGAIAARDGRIVFVGPDRDLPSSHNVDVVLDCDGRLITPGLVDCHTHLVFGGNRAAEFEMRLNGASYREIAEAGGGILSSVRATRAASEDDLVEAALPRLDALLAEGVTTVEIKSGYGLDHDTEARMLRAARRLEHKRSVTVRTTYLGAHALPPEATGKDEYVDLICRDILPALTRASLIDAVDAFCESIAFSPEQCARVFDTAARLGLPVKLHADQLSNSGGAKLAADHAALSADHLEYADEAGALAMAQSGAVAVLLPGAYYFLRETQAPPVAHFRGHGVRMAVATDCNPGSSPLTSLLLAANMAATLFRMTVEECLAGITREAARALGLGHEIGTLELGKWCDLAIWEVESPAELVYRIGFNPLHGRVRRGH